MLYKFSIIKHIQNKEYLIQNKEYLTWTSRSISHQSFSFQYPVHKGQVHKPKYSVVVAPLSLYLKVSLVEPSLISDGCFVRSK